MIISSPSGTIKLDMKVYKSADGRLWWINESLSDEDSCVCRVVEHGYLRHTAIWSRKDLKFLDEKEEHEQ